MIGSCHAYISQPLADLEMYPPPQTPKLRCQGFSACYSLLALVGLPRSQPGESLRFFGIVSPPLAHKVGIPAVSTLHFYSANSVSNDLFHASAVVAVAGHQVLFSGDRLSLPTVTQKQ